MRKNGKSAPLASLADKRRRLETMTVAVIESVKAHGGTVERVNQTEMKVTLPGVEKPIRVLLDTARRRLGEEGVVQATRFIEHYNRTRQPS